MNGKVWVLVLLAVASACGRSEKVHIPSAPVDANVDSGNAGEVPAPEMESTSLCADMPEEDRGNVLLLTEQDEEMCDSFEEIITFEISKDAPQTFLLYGTPSVSYCLEVYRTSGYITISHPRGIVTREGDLFIWCISPQTREREEMTVRSLTAQASFELLLP